jgi:hypothetical protein
VLGLASSSPGSGKDIAGTVVEKDKVDFLEQGFAFQVLDGLLQHDGSTVDVLTLF